MLCLGIESSCDDTGLALIENGTVLGQVLTSQNKIHALFGGVVPELASREHYRALAGLFDDLLRRTHTTTTNIDCIAVTRGPGLLGSLLVGVAFAKALALGLNVPLIGINHLHAHLLATGLAAQISFPCLGLLISGGHTNLYRLESPQKFILLGQTLDDAVGEILDKIAHVAGWPYPGGQRLDACACSGQNRRLFAPPYLHNHNPNFSFSGLKTAALTFLQNQPPHTEAAFNDFCASLFSAIAETLCVKTARVLQQQTDVTQVLVAGGVARSRFLRKALETSLLKLHISLLAPPPELCSDNAVMVAYLGWLLAKTGYQHAFNLQAVPRGKPLP